MTADLLKRLTEGCGDCVNARVAIAEIERLQAAPAAGEGIGVELIARAICKTGRFETGEGTCALRCLDQLGTARDNCFHTLKIHGPEARAILSELTAAGYAVVRREPTEAMKLAGAKAVEDHEWFHTWQENSDKVWQAMLKASEEER